MLLISFLPALLANMKGMQIIRMPTNESDRSDESNLFHNIISWTLITVITLHTDDVMNN